MSFLIISQALTAQSTNPQKKAKSIDQTVKQKLIKDEEKPKKVTYETGETINYLSNRMVYQLKKRLHLTDKKDEEEELKAKQKAAKGKFTFFGIVIEKH